MYPEDATNRRYEVPMDHPAGIEKPMNALYNVDHVNTVGGKFGVKVERALKSRVL